MRIAVLSRSEEFHSTRRLLEQARARGHEAHLLQILHARLRVTDKLDCFFDGAACPAVDAVVPRIGTFFPEFALTQLRALESAGVWSLNSSRAIETARDKLRAAIELAANGIPVPRTVLVKDLDQLDVAIDDVGGAPVVIKPISGSQGRGVMLGPTHESAISILEGMIFQSREVLVQEFVTDHSGSDLRVLVLDGVPVVTVRRRASEGRFRTNFHRGGSLERVATIADVEELAVRAAGAVGLRFAGVDLVLGKNGPQVLEVNPSPGWQGIESALGVDIATLVVQCLEASGDRSSGDQSPGDLGAGAKR
ncbi:MAG: RimK family alpha-L-glutamate ligase [Planctomycetota bacterium]